MATKQPKQREPLAEWVLRTTPRIVASPRAPQMKVEPEPEPSHPPQAASRPGQHRKSISTASKSPRYVTLHEWAAMMFSKPPHRNTLQKWVNEGHIQPQPKKIGRQWFVKPDAEYVS